MGKTTSTIVDLDAKPFTVDLEGPNSIFLPKKVMIRYTARRAKNLAFTISAEEQRPRATYSLYTAALNQYVPDLAFRLRYKVEKGHLSLGGLYRYFTYEDTLNNRARSSNGWGLSLGGSYRLVSRLKFLVHGTYAYGVASYVHDFMWTERDFVPSATRPGELEAVPVYGGFGAFEAQWTKKTKSSFVYSYLQAGDIGNKPPSSYQIGHYVLGNYVWFVLPKLRLATELIYGNRINKDGQEGSARRIYFMAQFDL
ncbi:MAG: hypothetical protein AB1714_28945 [Acidobacteriota bacterium]